MADPSEFGDFAIEGSGTTLDATNAVSLYEFTTDQDGAHTIVAALLAWQPGGPTAQYYVQAAWRNDSGALTADGSPLAGAVGTLTPVGVTIDVVGNTGRLLVTGDAGVPILWRMKGHRFDVTAAKRGAVSSVLPAEMGDEPISGSCVTNDGVTAVPLVAFTPEKDGVYTVQAIVVGWQPGGRCIQYYVENNWSKIGDTVAVDGTLYSDSVGTLSPVGLTADVSAGAARLLITGTNDKVLWRLKGVRLDVSA